MPKAAHRRIESPEADCILVSIPSSPGSSTQPKMSSQPAGSGRTFVRSAKLSRLHRKKPYSTKEESIGPSQRSGPVAGGVAATKPSEASQVIDLENPSPRRPAKRKLSSDSDDPIFMSSRIRLNSPTSSKSVAEPIASSQKTLPTASLSIPPKITANTPSTQTKQITTPASEAISQPPVTTTNIDTKKLPSTNAGAPFSNLIENHTVETTLAITTPNGNKITTTARGRPAQVNVTPVSKQTTVSSLTDKTSSSASSTSRPTPVKENATPVSKAIPQAGVPPEADKVQDAPKVTPSSIKQTPSWPLNSFGTPKATTSTSSTASPAPQKANWPTPKVRNGISSTSVSRPDAAGTNAATTPPVVKTAVASSPAAVKPTARPQLLPPYLTAHLTASALPSRVSPSKVAKAVMTGTMSPKAVASTTSRSNPTASSASALPPASNTTSQPASSPATSKSTTLPTVQPVASSSTPSSTAPVAATTSSSLSTAEAIQEASAAVLRMLPKQSNITPLPVTSGSTVPPPRSVPAVLPVLPSSRTTATSDTISSRPKYSTDAVIANGARPVADTVSPSSKISPAPVLATSGTSSLRPMQSTTAVASGSRVPAEPVIQTSKTPANEPLFFPEEVDIDRKPVLPIKPALPLKPASNAFLPAALTVPRPVPPAAPSVPSRTPAATIAPAIPETKPTEKITLKQLMEETRRRTQSEKNSTSTAPAISASTGPQALLELSDESLFRLMLDTVRRERPSFDLTDIRNHLNRLMSRNDSVTASSHPTNQSQATSQSRTGTPAQPAAPSTNQNQAPDAAIRQAASTQKIPQLSPPFIQEPFLPPSSTEKQLSPEAEADIDLILNHYNHYRASTAPAINRQNVEVTHQPPSQPSQVIASSYGLSQPVRRFMTTPTVNTNAVQPPVSKTSTLNPNQNAFSNSTSVWPSSNNTSDSSYPAVWRDVVNAYSSKIPPATLERCVVLLQTRRPSNAPSTDMHALQCELIKRCLKALDSGMSLPNNILEAIVDPALRPISPECYECKISWPPLCARSRPTDPCVSCVWKGAEKRCRIPPSTTARPPAQPHIVAQSKSVEADRSAQTPVPAKVQNISQNVPTKQPSSSVTNPVQHRNIAHEHNKISDTSAKPAAVSQQVYNRELMSIAGMLGVQGTNVIGLAHELNTVASSSSIEPDEVRARIQDGIRTLKQLAGFIPFLTASLEEAAK